MSTDEKEDAYKAELLTHLEEPTRIGQTDVAVSIHIPAELGLDVGTLEKTQEIKKDLLLCSNGLVPLGRDSFKGSEAFSGLDIMSRKHCRVAVSKDGIVVQDLNSTNGTHVYSPENPEPEKLQNKVTRVSIKTLDEDHPLVVGIPAKKGTGSLETGCIYLTFSKLPPEEIKKDEFVRVESGAAIKAASYRDAQEKCEDYLINEPGINLFGVADGVGGNPFGEVASLEGCEEALKAFADFCKDGPLKTEKAVKSAMEHAISAAAKRIINMGNDTQATGYDEKFSKMDTTLTLVHVFEDEEKNKIRCAIGIRGNSRVYRLRGDFIEQLTADDDFIAGVGRKFGLSETEIIAAQRMLSLIKTTPQLESMLSHPHYLDLVKRTQQTGRDPLNLEGVWAKFSSRIYGSLRSRDNSKATDVTFCDVRRGDTLLIVTDGIIGTKSGLTEQELQRVLEEAKSQSPKKMAEQLIAATTQVEDAPDTVGGAKNERKNPDDKTAVVIKI